MAVQTYNIQLDVKRILNGFTVKIDSSDQDGMDKFYGDQTEMVNDLKAHFEAKLNVLEQEYQNYLATLLLPIELAIDPTDPQRFTLTWNLDNKDLVPKDYEIEYNINATGWMANISILDKQYWDEALRKKTTKTELPSPLSMGDTIEFRVRGIHDGFPPSAWCNAEFIYNAEIT